MHQRDVQMAIRKPWHCPLKACPLLPPKLYIYGCANVNRIWGSTCDMTHSEKPSLKTTWLECFACSSTQSRRFQRYTIRRRTHCLAPPVPVAPFNPCAMVVPPLVVRRSAGILAGWTGFSGVIGRVVIKRGDFVRVRVIEM